MSDSKVCFIPVKKRGSLLQGECTLSKRQVPGVLCAESLTRAGSK